MSCINSNYIPKIMGIINCTPDSFYAPSRKTTLEQVLLTANLFIDAGANIIDIGGLSARPGSTLISEAEEIDRVIPIIQYLIKNIENIVISIDSFRSNVVEEALKSGAKIVNDISGGKFDPNLLNTVSKFDCEYICMHLIGNFENMHQNVTEKPIMQELLSYFQVQIQKLNALGIFKIILDPGIGFSKSIPQNFEIIKNLSTLKTLKLTILIGISRKSFIYKSLNISPEDSLHSTSILHFLALQNGANILRVHDVKQASETIQLYKLLKNY